MEFFSAEMDNVLESVEFKESKSVDVDVETAISVEAPVDAQNTSTTTNQKNHQKTNRFEIRKKAGGKTWIFLCYAFVFLVALGGGIFAFYLGFIIQKIGKEALQQEDANWGRRHFENGWDKFTAGITEIVHEFITGMSKLFIRTPRFYHNEQYQDAAGWKKKCTEMPPHLNNKLFARLCHRLGEKYFESK